MGFQKNDMNISSESPDKTNKISDKAIVMSDRANAMSGNSDGMSGKANAMSGNSDAMSDKANVMSDRAHAMSGNSDAMSGNTDGMAGKANAMPGNTSLMSDKNPVSHREREDDETLNLLRFVHLFFIHKWKILILVIISLIGAWIYYHEQKVYYVAQYEIFYNESVKEYVTESDVPVLKSNFDKNFWLSTMKSDEVAKLTLINSGLPLDISSIKNMIKVEMQDIKNSNSTPIFRVSVRSSVKENIPILVNSFVESINEVLVRNQADNSKRLITFLSGQLDESNKKLAEIDNDIMIGNVNGSQTNNSYSETLTDLEKFRADLLNVQIELYSVKASKQSTEKELIKLDGTVVSESSFSEPLKVQLMNLQVDLARALTKNKENHPQVKAIRENIVQINSMMRDSIQQQVGIKNMIQNPLKSQLMSKLIELRLSEISLETKESSLKRVISDYQRRTLPDSTSDNQRQFFRNRELIFSTINILNSKLIEVQSAAQGSLSRFVLIDQPQTPQRPANKGLYYILAIGLLAGLIVGAVMVFLLDFVDNRIMLSEDYESMYKIPVLATLRHRNRGEGEFFDFEPHEDSYNKYPEFGEMVVNTKYLLRNSNKRLISVCSPLRKEGKSMISFLLAKSLAEKGLNVLLVDMDLFVPKLTIKLAQDMNPGLTDYFSGDCSIDDIISTTPTQNLSFVGRGINKLSPMFSYEDETFLNFLNRARSSYDVVILDTPAALYIPDIISFMEHIDSVIFVVRLRYTTRLSLNRMIKMITPYRSKIFGTILNDMKKELISKYSSSTYYYKVSIR